MQICEIPHGATLWARQAIESKIFCDKPDKWFKIWFYLINRVNFKTDKRFKRGELFLKYEWICEATKATKSQIDHFMRWAKKEKMLRTKKTTRGMIVEIIKYDRFQTLDNYYYDVKSDTEIGDRKSDTDGDTEKPESKPKKKKKVKAKAKPKATRTAKQKRNKSDTILKNGKNDKNDTINLRAEPAEVLTKEQLAENKLKGEVNSILDIFYDNVNPTLNYRNTTTRKACIFLLNKYGYEAIEKLTNYVIKKQGEKFFPVVTTPYQLKEKLGAIIVHKKKEDREINSL